MMTEIERAINDKGYHVNEGRTFVSCNFSSSALTVEDIIYTLYKHAASLQKVMPMSYDEIVVKLKEERIKQNEGPVYHISSIGAVPFECDVYPQSIDITAFERQHGSARDVIRALWDAKIRGNNASQIKFEDWDSNA